MGGIEFWILLALTLPLFVAPSFFRKTALNLDLNKGATYPLLMMQSLISIIPAYLLIQFYGVEQFSSSFHVATNDVAFSTGLWIVYSLYLFAISLAVALKFCPLPKRVDSSTLPLISHSEKAFAAAALLTGLLLLTVGILFLGYQHAFLYSLMTGDLLLRVRLDNVYQSSLPTQISYLFRLCSWILAVHAGRALAERLRARSFFFLVAALLLASVRGDKAPLVGILILYLIARMSLKPIKFSPIKLFLYSIMGVSSVLFMLFWIVKIQYPDLSVEDYSIYLANRAGVGQMAGAYESFAVGRLNGSFFWHMIPFASIFVDYPIYDKELMVLVEGVDRLDIGVKNSLFISEAFGIGGYPLLLISPVVVGVSYAISLLIGYKGLKFLFGRPIAFAYFLPLFMMSMDITGNFSSFPFLKSCILNLVVICLLWPAYFFANRLMKRKIFRVGRLGMAKLSAS